MAEYRGQEKIRDLKVEELTERLKEIETQIEGENRPEKRKKIIKQEIKDYLEELQKTPSFAPAPSTRDELEEIKKLEPTQQVGALISLVFEKGLLQAISVAQKLNNPAILDEFHDTLTDRYYQMLVEKGILKH